MHNAGIYLVVLALIPIGFIFDKSFIGASNLNNMFTGMQHLLLVVIGASFITYSGKMADLSIPFTMVCSGFAAVYALQFGLTAAFGAALLVGLIVGAINGLVIGYLKLNAIIWTFAMNFILTGMVRLIMGGRQIYPEGEWAATFEAIAGYRIFGFIPPVILMAVFLGFVFHYIMKHSNFGRDVQLTGSSEQVAEATGVNTGKLILFVFIISSCCTALAGLTAASSSLGANYQLGDGKDFDAVTAIVLGGISLQGGKGFLSGAIGGLLLISMIQNIMSNIPGVNNHWQAIVKAVIFISVVAVNTHISRKAGRA